MTISNRTSAPPPISRALRLLLGAWLLLIGMTHATTLGGTVPATMSVTVVALAAFYVALHLLLVRGSNLHAAVTAIIALAPVAVVSPWGAPACSSERSPSMAYP